jgi:hypothetical protein
METLELILYFLQLLQLVEVVVRVVITTVRFFQQNQEVLVGEERDNIELQLALPLPVVPEILHQ